MLKVYIACGEIFDNTISAMDTENNAFNAWIDDNEMATGIISASGGGNATSVLRNYWDKHINRDPSIDCVKLVDSQKDCAASISGYDDDELKAKLRDAVDAADGLEAVYLLRTMWNKDDENRCGGHLG